ncbi:UNVERIFIED_ORG: hypothetical protein E4P37_11400 [Bacillus sp. AZ43]
MTELRVAAAGPAMAEPLIDGDTAQLLAQTLSTWRTVDRRHVHKAALSEVLVTDLTELGPDRYAVAVQWPRRHPSYRPEADGDPHPLLFVESLRQAGICLTHERLGVPLGHQFVFLAIGARYGASRLPRRPEPTTVVLVIRVDLHGPTRRPNGAHLDIEAWCGSVRIATATATYRCLSPGAYARMRRPAPAPAAVHQAVARDPSAQPSPEGDARTTLVTVDRSDPTYFDHAVDHLPGMLLMDAALAAAGIDGPASWPRLRGFDLAFGRYAELDVPILLTSRPAVDGEGRRVDVTISQGGQAAATGTVRVGPTKA